MQVTKQGDFYRIARVTGPTHNALLISFAVRTEADIATPVIEALPPMGDCQHENLNSDTILSEVLEGVQEGNTQFVTAYHVPTVQYVLNDTRPESAYRYLAFKLIEHLARAESENV
jgi:hypothetical protein